MGARGPGAKPTKKTTLPAAGKDKRKPRWQHKGLSRAERVIRFVQTLQITSGPFAGQRLKLRPWQRDIVGALYATDAGGRRIVRTGLVTMPRKNGKTQLSAALALAHLVGPTGAVTAIEFDRGLAQRAANNLQSVPNVAVVHGDGTAVDFEPADVIYVSAGATRPADKWLDGLREGGRLLVPLTTNTPGEFENPVYFRRRGAMFLFTRKGSAYAAKWVMAAAFIPCQNARDEESQAALASALAAGGWERVTGLHRGGDVPDRSCWLRGPGWCLMCD